MLRTAVLTCCSIKAGLRKHSPSETHASQSWWMSCASGSPPPPPEQDEAHSASMYSGLLSHSPPLAQVPQLGFLSAGAPGLGGAGDLPLLCCLGFLVFFLHADGQRSFINARLFSHSPSRTQLAHCSKRSCGLKAASPEYALPPPAPPRLGGDGERVKKTVRTTAARSTNADVTQGNAPPPFFFWRTAAATAADFPPAFAGVGSCACDCCLFLFLPMLFFWRLRSNRTYRRSVPSTTAMKAHSTVVSREHRKARATSATWRCAPFQEKILLVRRN